MTHKICAIRETFEESGLLLTHPPAHTVLQDSVREEWRLKVHEDASQFKVLCETFKLTPAVDKLLPFANWITPEAEKRRYNTHFFLTMLDDASVTKRIEGEAALAADGKETVQLDWLTPEQGKENNLEEPGGGGGRPEKEVSIVYASPLGEDLPRRSKDSVF